MHVLEMQHIESYASLHTESKSDTNFNFFHHIRSICNYFFQNWISDQMEFFS